MQIPIKRRRTAERAAAGIALLLMFGPPAAAQDAKPLILQEMSWTDVADYLKSSDMVIIPIGSTEQHGPHMPLGTDFYEATGMSEMISARTGVLVAPVLMAGYSVYHSGFPGSLSLKPETLEQVLFETAEMLIKYGFRRFMFFNYHGGNNTPQANVIHRINHNTPAVAVAIGVGSAIQRGGVSYAPFDNHAGIGETSLMLFFKPELVRMDRIEKPKMKLTPEMQQILELSKEHPDLMRIFSSLRAVPAETGKGGASHELSSNGIWTTGDPADATREIGEKDANRMVGHAVRFIQAWKKVNASRKTPVE